MSHSSQNKLKDQQIYGHRVWNILHSMAAYYPEQPTPEDMNNHKEFIDSFMEIGIDYDEWGKNFLHKMREQNPIDLSSRQQFSVWMCKQHNLFNKDLGKQQYDCDYSNLKQRWGPP